jgi:hypothetical protein
MGDPVYKDALTEQNIKTNTVFSSQGLVLVAVSWSWAVALKLVRYRKDDPSDIASILSLGTKVKGCQWTVDLLQMWLLTLCGPMGYANYPLHEIRNTQSKMLDAIKRAQQLPWTTVPVMQYQPPPKLVAYNQPAPPALHYSHHPPTSGQEQRPLTVHEGMFDHDRRHDEVARERMASSRQRTRSFSGAHPSHPRAPSSAMPMPAPPPVPPVPQNPVVYDPRHSRSRSQQRLIYAAPPPAPSIPQPPAMSARPAMPGPQVMVYYPQPAAMPMAFRPTMPSIPSAPSFLTHPVMPPVVRIV